jgi:hypothetical protein
VRTASLAELGPPEHVTLPEARETREKVPATAMPSTVLWSVLFASTLCRSAAGKRSVSGALEDWRLLLVPQHLTVTRSVPTAHAGRSPKKAPRPELSQREASSGVNAQSLCLVVVAGEGACSPL